MTFEYVLGAYQSKIGAVPKHCFSVTSRDSAFVDRIRESLESQLGKKIYHGPVAYVEKGKVKTRERMVLWNKGLLDQIRDATEDNIRVPRGMLGGEEGRLEYLRAERDTENGLRLDG